METLVTRAKKLGHAGDLVFERQSLVDKAIQSWSDLHEDVIFKKEHPDCEQTPESKITYDRVNPLQKEYGFNDKEFHARVDLLGKSLKKAAELSYTVHGIEPSIPERRVCFRPIIVR
jgi:hypothetical protein